MEPRTTFSRASGWLTAWVDRELVMMNASSDFYLGLSGSGGRIWELLETPQTIDELCALLSSEYETGHEAVEAEVTTFLKQLEEYHAVDVHREAAV